MGGDQDASKYPALHGPAPAAEGDPTPSVVVLRRTATGLAPVLAVPFSVSFLKSWTAPLQSSPVPPVEYTRPCSWCHGRGSDVRHVAPCRPREEKAASERTVDDIWKRSPRNRLFPPSGSTRPLRIRVSFP